MRDYFAVLCRIDRLTLPNPNQWSHGTTIFVLCLGLCLTLRINTPPATGSAIQWIVQMPSAFRAWRVFPPRSQPCCSRQVAHNCQPNRLVAPPTDTCTPPDHLQQDVHVWRHPFGLHADSCCMWFLRSYHISPRLRDQGLSAPDGGPVSRK